MISQPNSTILFECDSVDQYSMLHSIINLNNKKRLIQEGLIVPSKWNFCGYSAYTSEAYETIDPFAIIDGARDFNMVMPDNMDDVSNFYISALATGFSTFTINIKFSDLFFDSIFNNGDYLLKYGCYILIQWNTRDNIIWGIDTFAAQAEIPSNTFIVEADNVINVSNICLQIDQ